MTLLGFYLPKHRVLSFVKVHPNQTVETPVVGKVNKQESLSRTRSETKTHPQTINWTL